VRYLKLVLFGLIVILGVSSYAKAAPLSQVPRILYVMEGETGDCLNSWATACELQTAMFKANPGDQIWVAKGTYKPTKSATRTATFQLESGVAIYGGFPPADGTWIQRDWVNNLTTLSGDIGLPGDNSDNSYHVVTGSGVDINAVLDGFTISGGNANGAEPHNYGGGMYNSGGSPVLTNVTFTENSAAYYGSGMYNVGGNPKLTNVTFTKNLATKYGGGMYNDYGSPVLTNVTFTENSATDYGGGMVNTSSSPMLTDVTFTKNSATVGGGMSNESSNPTLTNVTFSGNKASNGGGMVNNFSGPTLTNVTFTENRASAFGGGMVNWSSSPTLTNVTLTKNSAVVGGGMSNQSSSSPTLTNVTFTDNSATYSGGGMVDESSSPMLTNVSFSGNMAGYGGGMGNEASSPTLTNVTFSGNSATIYGGGMYNFSTSPTLTNVTFTGNSAALYGGGMWNFSTSPTLTNAIVWGNTPALDQIKNVTDSHLTVTYSDIEGGFDGDGNINDDPHLGPLADNGGFTQTLALLSGSPAIDTANPAFCPTYDQRYYARPIDGDGNGSAICDMGAFEYGSSVDGFTLTVTVVGNGSVAKIPDKVGYLYGEVVTLTATANPGWTFSSWGGDATGTENPLTITIDRITTITANFTQDEYALTETVNPAESGTVIRSPDQATYHYGDIVSLTAVSGANWQFTGWSGDSSGTENPLTVTVYGNTTITANFTRIYKLYLPLILKN